MQKLGKFETQVPDFSFFIPSLDQRLRESEGRVDEGENGDALWEPRSTVLVSIGVSIALWASIGTIVWLAFLR